MELIELEKVIIFSTLEHREYIPLLIKSGLDPDQFLSGECAEIFSVIRDLFYKKHPEITIPIVTRRVHRDETIQFLQSTFPTSIIDNKALFVDYIDNYKEKYREYQLEQVLQNSLLDLHDQHRPDKVRSNLLGDLFSSTFEETTEGLVSMESLIPEVMSTLKDNTKNFYPTPFVRFNTVLGGLGKSEFILLAARPSLGKTTLALQFSIELARMGFPVCFFSLEMSKRQLVQRMLAYISDVSGYKIRTVTYSEDDYDNRLLPASKEISSLPIFINDSGSTTPEKLISEIHAFSLRYEDFLIVVDYVQLMIPPRSDTENRELTLISKALKSTAKRYNVPLLCVSQLSRKPEEGEGRKPRLSDLRGSGSLEQDADSVIFLHNRHRWTSGEEARERRRNCQLIIAKNRNGPALEEIQIRSIFETFKFEELA